MAHVQEYKEHIARTENLSNFPCTPGEWKQISAVITVIEGTF